jgi:acetyl-CoA acyltransferase
MSGLLAGLPVEVPGTTVNRLCGSGMDAVGLAARSIKSGETELMIAGGVESMSRAPFVMGKAESAFSRSAAIYDTTIGWRFINPLMKKLYETHSMPQTADNVAADFNIAAPTRTPSRCARSSAGPPPTPPAASSRRAGAGGDPAQEGRPVVFDTDEHPRPDTTLEMLAKLKGVNGPELSVTAGNASGVNDGACALLLASEAAAGQHGLTPRPASWPWPPPAWRRASWASARRRRCARCWPRPA